MIDDESVSFTAPVSVSTLIRLPPELILSIFDFLVETPFDFANITSTCKAFFSLLHRNVLGPSPNLLVQAIRSRCLHRLEVRFPLRHSGSFLSTSFLMYPDVIFPVGDNTIPIDWPRCLKVESSFRPRMTDRMQTIYQKWGLESSIGSKYWKEVAATNSEARRYKINSISDYCDLHSLFRLDRKLWWSYDCYMRVMDRWARLQWTLVLPIFFLIAFPFIYFLETSYPLFLLIKYYILFISPAVSPIVVSWFFRMIRTILVEYPVATRFATDELLRFMLTGKSRKRPRWSIEFDPFVEISLFRVLLRGFAGVGADFCITEAPELMTKWSCSWVGVAHVAVVGVLFCSGLGWFAFDLCLGLLEQFWFIVPGFGVVVLLRIFRVSSWALKRALAIRTTVTFIVFLLLRMFFTDTHVLLIFAFGWGIYALRDKRLDIARGSGKLSLAMKDLVESFVE